MLGQAVDAFVRADGGLGRAVCLMDDEVDKLNQDLFRIVVTHILEDPKNISTAIELLLVGRNLERRRPLDQHRRGCRVSRGGQADQAPHGGQTARLDSGGIWAPST